MSTLQIAMFIFIILLGIDIERWCRKLEKSWTISKRNYPTLSEKNR